MAEILRVFDLATPLERRQIFFELLARLTSDELDAVEVYRLWQGRRFDVFGNCPMEIQLCIVEQMGLADVCACMLVCRRWRASLTTNTGPVVQNLLLERFPTLLRPSGDVQELPARQKGEVLRRALQAWSARTAARFPIRLITALEAPAGQGRPRCRFQRLEDGRFYREALCSGYTSRQETTPPPSRPDSSVSAFYSDGTLAYQVAGRNAGSVQPIIVHRLHTLQRRHLTSPRHSLVQGNPPKLMAVGNQLVVAVSGRTVIAWDFDFGDPVDISLPSTPILCTAKDRTVYIETQDNQLYVWEGLRVLLGVDTAEPGVRPRPGRTTPHLLERPSAGEYTLPVIPHLLDPAVFFLVAFEPLTRGELVIYKFKKADGRYTPVDSSTTHVSPRPEVEAERRLARPHDASWRPPVLAGFLDIQKIDSRGTYQMLKIQSAEGKTGSHHFKYLTFNTVTERVTTTDYHTPESAQIQEATFRSGRASCLWEDHLVFAYEREAGFHDQPSPLLLAFASQTGGPSAGPLASSISVSPSGASFWESMQQELESSDGRPDIIRRRDLVAQNPTGPSSSTPYRFVCAWPLDTKTCTYRGLPHVAGCLRHLHPTSSLLVQEYFALRQTNMGRENMFTEFIGPNTDSAGVTAIYRDDDFLVVMTSSRELLVFSLDQDGRWNRTAEEEEQVLQMSDTTE